jgi:hypothetical protein
MEVNFKVTNPAPVEPIVFDIIFAEKVGGGIVKNCAYDLPVGVAIDAAGNAVKCYEVVENAASDATSIKIKKGSGVASGDVIAKGKKGVASTALDTTNAEYDIVTVSLGVAVSAGDRLYQATAASASSATPKYTPKFVLGEFIPANSGDKLVKLVNGANVRKETIKIADDMLALMPLITAL